MVRMWILNIALVLALLKHALVQPTITLVHASNTQQSIFRSSPASLRDRVNSETVL